MAQYINKDALVAEIKALINTVKVTQKAGLLKKRDADAKITLFKSILSLIHAIEVKEFWKPANGDNLPEIDKEVIVLTQPYPLESAEYVISFAHRPNPDGWDGKSMLTGKIEHYQPKTYDKSGWNMPNIKWWLDLDLPVIEEE